MIALLRRIPFSFIIFKKMCALIQTNDYTLHVRLYLHTHTCVFTHLAIITHIFRFYYWVSFYFGRPIIIRKLPRMCRILVYRGCLIGVYANMCVRPTAEVRHRAHVAIVDTHDTHTHQTRRPLWRISWAKTIRPIRIGFCMQGSHPHHHHHHHQHTGIG